MDTFKKKKIYLINMLSIRLIWSVNVTLLHPSFWKEREKGHGNDERANDSSLTWFCCTVNLQAPSQTLMWCSLDKRTLSSVTDGSLSRFNEHKWTMKQSFTHDWSALCCLSLPLTWRLKVTWSQEIKVRRDHKSMLMFTQHYLFSQFFPLIL